MTTGPLSICFYCKLYKENNGVPICSAFPDGIPDDIFFEAFDHRKPFKGDNGIRFEPKEGIDKKDLDIYE